MNTLLVHAADLVATPWINGKGITRDVFGETLSDGRTDWLISIAELRVDAEFSYFDEVDRTFTLLEGEGIELVFDDAPAVRCHPFVPISFPGDRTTRCRVAAGPGNTFNVFARRSGPQFIVSVLTLVKNHPLKMQGNPVAIHCATGSAMVGRHRLITGSTIISPPTADIISQNCVSVLIAVHRFGE